MPATVTLILDVVIAGLLIATIVYAVILNRQLINLRESRGEMEGLIRSFNEATARAEAGIKSMKRTATETGEGLQRTVERAQALRDELQFMIEAADALARRLADTPASGRGAAAPAAAPPAGSSRRPAPEPSYRMPDLDDVSQDLPRGRGVLTRNDPGPRPERRLPEVPEPRRAPPELEDTSQDLPRGRGILSRNEPERLEPPKSKTEAPRPVEAARRPATPEEGRPARREGGDGLSRAERELLEAMENRR